MHSYNFDTQRNLPPMRREETLVEAVSRIIWESRYEIAAIAISGAIFTTIGIIIGINAGG